MNYVTQCIEGNVRFYQYLDNLPAGERSVSHEEYMNKEIRHRERKSGISDVREKNCTWGYHIDNADKDGYCPLCTYKGAPRKKYYNNNSSNY